MDGIILIDKPSGISSAEVVRRIKAKVKPARVGHLGTLDPFATGVLPILIGEATKLAPFVEGHDKDYEGLIKLGAETDTLDRDGKVIRETPVPKLDASFLSEVAARFTGTIQQTPPIFSAIKRGGIRLYKLARKGIEVAAPAPRTIQIKRLALEAESADLVRFRATCSTGTYARSLARDIGLALGTVAHLFELKRLRNGSFALEDALPLNQALEEIALGAMAHIVGLCEALGEMSEVAVDCAVERRIRNGDARALDSLVPAGAELFKVVHEGRLLAIARSTTRVTARLERVFASPSCETKAAM